MKRWLIGGGLLLLLVAWLAYINWPEAKAVQVATVERGLVEATVANTRVGSIIACERSRLSPAIGGQVAILHVTEGDRVAPGDILLELWNKDRKAQLQQAQAMLEFTRQDQQRICISAQADQREANRIARLAEKQLASEEQADQTRSRARASQAACASARARQEEAAASVAVAEAALDQTLLRAPFAGVIAEVTGEVGEFTTPSPPGVATPPAIDLLTDTCYYVSAPIDEVDAALVQTGMPVRVTLDAFRGRVFNGRVRRISVYVQEFEKQARTVEVEVSLDTEDQTALIAGYSADVEILLATRPDTLRVPAEALRDEGDESAAREVLVLGPDNRIQRRQVKVGLKNWNFAEILSGLQEGERVILALGRTDLEVGDLAVAE